MARKTKTKPKANKTKDQIARDLQAGMLKSSPAENLQRNVEFAGQMSTSIGSIIENLSVQNDVDFSEEQKKIFQDMLDTLKKIATSQGDTGRDREELRTMFAKMVVQTEKQTEKIEKDIVEKDKEVESKEEEVRYLKHWQEKAQEDTTLSEKEKENIQKDLEARQEELKVLRTDKERLTKTLETQKKLGEEIKSKMQEPEQKRLTMMDAIKGDTTAALRKFAPGLDWNPEEGQSYGDMLKGNLKKMTTGKGFMEAFGSVLLEPDKKRPSNEQLIEAERQAAAQQEELENLTGRLELKDDTSDVAVAEKDTGALSDVTEKAQASESVLPTLQSILQEVTVIRGIVEGSMTREKGGKYRDTDTGQYMSKASVREAGKGLYTQEELAAQNESAASITSPAKVLSNLESEGKIDSAILSSLEQISNNTKTSADIDEERDREEDSNQSTLTESEVKGEIETSPSATAVKTAAVEENTEGSGGGMGQMITNRLGGRVARNIGGRLGDLAARTGGLRGRAIQGASRLLLGGMSTAATGGAAAAGTAAAGTAAAAGGAAAGGGMLAAAGGLAAAAAPWVAGAAAIGAVGYGAYKLWQWRKKKREEKAQLEEAQKAQLQAKQAQISTEASTKTSSMVEEATDKANIETAPVSNQSTIVNNVSSMGGGGETPAMGPTEVRIQDNSFIRFQDKRVARV